MRGSLPSPDPFPLESSPSFHVPKTRRRNAALHCAKNGAGSQKSHAAHASWAQESSPGHLPSPGYLSRVPFFLFPALQPYAGTRQARGRFRKPWRCPGFAGAGGCHRQRTGTHVPSFQYRAGLNLLTLIGTRFRGRGNLPSSIFLHPEPHSAFRFILHPAQASCTAIRKSQPRPLNSNGAQISWPREFVFVDLPSSGILSCPSNCFYRAPNTKSCDRYIKCQLSKNPVFTAVGFLPTAAQRSHTLQPAILSAGSVDSHEA